MGNAHAQALSHVEKVKKLHSAFMVQDVETILDCLSENVITVFPGPLEQGVGKYGTYFGKNGFKEFLNKIISLEELFDVKYGPYTVGENVVMCVGKTHRMSKLTGKHIKYGEDVTAFHFDKSGLIQKVECWDCLSDPQLRYHTVEMGVSVTKGRFSAGSSKEMLKQHETYLNSLRSTEGFVATTQIQRNDSEVSFISFYETIDHAKERGKVYDGLSPIGNQSGVTLEKDRTVYPGFWFGMRPYGFSTFPSGTALKLKSAAEKRKLMKVLGETISDFREVTGSISFGGFWKSEIEVELFAHYASAKSRDEGARIFKQIVNKAKSFLASAPVRDFHETGFVYSGVDAFYCDGDIQFKTEASMDAYWQHVRNNQILCQQSTFVCWKDEHAEHTLRFVLSSTPDLFAMASAHSAADTKIKDLRKNVHHMNVTYGGSTPPVIEKILTPWKKMKNVTVKKIDAVKPHLFLPSYSCLHDDIVLEFGEFEIDDEHVEEWISINQEITDMGCSEGGKVFYEIEKNKYRWVAFRREAEWMNVSELVGRYLEENPEVLKIVKRIDGLFIVDRKNIGKKAIDSMQQWNRGAKFSWKIIEPLEGSMLRY